MHASWHQLCFGPLAESRRTSTGPGVSRTSAIAARHLSEVSGWFQLSSIMPGGETPRDAREGNQKEPRREVLPVIGLDVRRHHLADPFGRARGPNAQGAAAGEPLGFPGLAFPSSPVHLPGL